jgi:hypothetical protein
VNDDVRTPTIWAAPDITWAWTPHSREAVVTGSGAGATRCCCRNRHCIACAGVTSAAAFMSDITT